MKRREEIKGEKEENNDEGKRREGRA